MSILFIYIKQLNKFMKIIYIKHINKIIFNMSQFFIYIKISILILIFYHLLYLFIKIL